MAGLLKETGVWLRESGGVGVLQEVDVVVLSSVHAEWSKTRSHPIMRKCDVFSR
jgi:hypothetical protein